MRKLLVYTFLVVGSALILGTAAGAQSPIRYRAQIPFDFQASGVQYAAGEYLLGPSSLVNRTTLAIRDTKSGKVRYLGQTTPGGDNWLGKGRMVFVKSDGHYTLSEIETPEFGLTFNLPRAKDGVGMILSSKVETVAINLH